MNTVKKFKIITEIKEILNMNDKIQDFEKTHNICLSPKHNTEYLAQIEMLKFYKDTLNKNKIIKLIQSDTINPMVKLLNSQLEVSSNYNNYANKMGKNTFLEIPNPNMPDPQYYSRVCYDLNNISKTKENYLTIVDTIKQSVLDPYLKISLEDNKIFNGLLIQLEDNLYKSSLSEINNVFERDINSMFINPSFQKYPDLKGGVIIGLQCVFMNRILLQRLETVKERLIAISSPFNEAIEEEYKKLNNGQVEKNLYKQIMEKLVYTNEVPNVKNNTDLKFTPNKINELRSQLTSEETTNEFKINS